MSTENWLALMAIAVTVTTGIGVPVAMFLLKYAIRVSSDVAVIKATFVHFDEHTQSCVADRRRIWSAVRQLKQRQEKSNA